ncbi:hypothetical protein, partial [Microcoleus sp. herbarium19]|uniref:hypothetical protein n=1 Tax=Microcoleus sp. herbarium19 TaxID=3055440 RepID=UPI002FD1ECDE
PPFCKGGLGGVRAGCTILEKWYYFSCFAVENFKRDRHIENLTFAMTLVLFSSDLFALMPTMTK